MHDLKSKIMDKESLTLILLPGMDGTGLGFDPFLAVCKPEFYEIKMISYPKTESLTYKELIRYVQDKLPKMGNLVVLGESFSGPIAVELAARIPAIKGIILCSTFVRRPHPMLKFMYPLLSRGFSVKMPVKILDRILFGEFSTPSLKALVKTSLSDVSREVMQKRLYEVVNVDVTKTLACLRIPSLYLRGEHDQLLPQSVNKWILKHKPDIKEIVFNAPHGVLQTVSDEAFKVIDGFMREVEYV